MGFATQFPRPGLSRRAAKAHNRPATGRVLGPSWGDVPLGVTTMVWYVLQAVGMPQIYRLHSERKWEGMSKDDKDWWRVVWRL